MPQSYYQKAEQTRAKGGGEWRFGRLCFSITERVTRQRVMLKHNLPLGVNDGSDQAGDRVLSRFDRRLVVSLA